jgi:hypothetical protein
MSFLNINKNAKGLLMNSAVKVTAFAQRVFQAKRVDKVIASIFFAILVALIFVGIEEEIQNNDNAVAPTKNKLINLDYINS